MCGKMAEELLSLKWNNHQAHFVDILTFLREQEIFVDATLACGGKLYAAHKFVLSTCSDYFKQMFTKNPSKHPIVFMKDVTSRDLEALLDFMYNGEVNVPQSSLGSLIKTAEGLQIKGLAVPDDPPAPKRDRDRDREKRESRTQLDHHSPPAKRPRPRERSPPQSSPSQPQVNQPISSHPPSATQLSRSRSPQPPASSGSSQVGMPPVEATLDEDSRTSIQSGLSGLSEQNTSTTPSLSAKPGGGNCQQQQQQQQQQQANAGDSAAAQADALQHSQSGEEPSPGPSGLHKHHQSKEEPEFEIKQEDVVDLGEDDEGDWGVEGDGGGGESSMGTENPPNFPEVMLPHSDGTMPATGDPAMWRIVSRAAGEPRRRYPCDYCGKLFRRQYDATQHERLHTGDLPYSCSLCNKKFINKSHYNYHVTRSLEHRTNKAGGRSRSRPSSVGVPAAATSAAAEAAPADSAPVTTTDTAPASASSSTPASTSSSTTAAPAATSGLVSTVTSAYDPDTPLAPAVTSASTSGLEGLDPATTPADGTAPDPTAEDSKESKGWPGLSKHHHPGEAPILGLARVPLHCAPALNPQVASLTTDAELRPFSCLFCNSRFKTKQHLVQHQRLHTGEKPYACSRCPARFTQMTPLKRHMAKAHLEIGPVPRLPYPPPPPPSSSAYALAGQHHVEHTNSPPLNSHSPAHKY
ncbi:zinc finger protein 48-like isoform X3 [Eriocheir sinensis]|uniref:zinc finger protein 48-like isoform X3 n=1 Tax=Eriocheir sinensis TaxID=95602 RepID=UPI0021C78A8D|nr:zinc finger protein 48-like isoform X3 [Eriocheir sinensis]